LGPDARAIREAAPGLLWIAVVFTAVLGLARVYDPERENRGMEGLFQYPGSRAAVYAGKLLGLLLLLLFVEAVLFVLGGLLYNLDLLSVAAPLALVAFLGTLGIAGIGTLYGALTLNLRAREVLLPLLVFPLVVPVVLATVSATRALFLGDAFGELGAWLRLLAAYDIVFTVTPLIAFERVLAE
ncbi:MAG TPA: heme exporter protein CcmB, partial [Longimicrobiales bacterium]|nr:heme exporter protein CcmB [Longimicrobiales bacterium]